MNEQSHDIFVDPNEEIRGIQASWEAWAKKMRSVEDYRTRLAQAQEDRVDDHQLMDEIDSLLWEVGLAAGKKIDGESVYDKLAQAEDVIREAAHKVEIDLAKARGEKPPEL